MEIQRSYIEHTGVVSPVSIHSEGPGQSPLAELAILGSSRPPQEFPSRFPPCVPPGPLQMALQVFPQETPPGTPLQVSPCVSSGVPQVSTTQETVPRVPPGLERSGLRISTQRCIPEV